MLSHTYKEDHHTIYINFKINFNEIGFKNTCCSAESKLCLYEHFDQLQTMIFLFILWLLDKRRVGVNIAFKLLYKENNQEHPSWLFLFPSFLFSQKKWTKTLFFSLLEKDEQKVLSNNCQKKKMTKNYRKISYFSIYTNY